MKKEQIINTPYSRAQVRWLANNAVRITHSPPPDDKRQATPEPFPPDRPWMAHVFNPEPDLPLDEPELQVETKDGLVSVKTGDGQDLFREAGPPQLGLRKRRFQASFNVTKTAFQVGLGRVDQGIKLALAIEPGESFYGWGEYFDAFRRNSGEVKMRIRDAIASLQARGETYSSIPLFYSSRGYAFFLLNSHASRWRIDTEVGRMEIEAEGPGADYLLIYGPYFRRILRTYTALTGRPPMPPRWAFGLWVTSYPQGDQDSVLAHVAEHRRLEIPLDAVILDYHWEERYHNFHWRPSLFPDPDGLIDSLQEAGVRLGLILTPFLNRHNRPLQKLLLNAVVHNIPPGAFWDDERDLEGFKEAKAAGYLAHENTRWWFGAGGMFDFANPAAAAWWNKRMRPLYRQGVAFFKNDDGEYLPENGRGKTGESLIDGREYHNIYGFYYGRALYKAMVDLDEADSGVRRRGLIYARSGWAGSQRYPALFLGDQKPTFEGIKNTLQAGLNLSLLGFAYWTPDVFGLEGKTTPETHMRYAQWALLAPVARYFWRPPEIDNTRFPWSHNPQVAANFRKYSQLRYRLLPYYVALAWQAYQTGEPIMRPMVLEFQHEADLAGVYDQVMLGDRLMLCPVVESGATARRIRLPEGVWHDFWSQQEWRGPGEIEYQASLDCLPILVRGGTVLPLGPELDFIPENHNFDQITLMVWPPFPASGQVYDDDGRTTAYQSGAYSLSPVSADEEEDRLKLRIEAAQGTFPRQANIRQLTLRLQRSAKPRQVTVNSLPLDNWQYDEAHMETVIALTCPVDRETVVEIFTIGGD